MLNNISYKDDYSIIKETIILVGFLLEEDKITQEILSKIDENIKYLDQKYDDLYILVNLFDPIHISYKKMLKQKYVDYLRKQNRKKERQLVMLFDKDKIKDMEYDPGKKIGKTQN